MDLQRGLHGACLRQRRTAPFTDMGSAFLAFACRSRIAPVLPVTCLPRCCLLPIPSSASSRFVYRTSANLHLCRVDQSLVSALLRWSLMLEPTVSRSDAGLWEGVGSFQDSFIFVDSSVWQSFHVTPSQRGPFGRVSFPSKKVYPCICHIATKCTYKHISYMYI
jgi:hypothetical protein